MDILPFDYFSGHETTNRGLLSLTRLISNDREDPSSTTLLFDNGDFLQGNSLADLLAAERPAVNPAMALLNNIGFDAIALGNHEFNYGLDYLDKCLKQLECPVLCANIERKTTTAIERPYTILSRSIACSDEQDRQIKIGVIGAVTPQVPIWDRAVLKDEIKTHDIVKTVQRFIPQIKAAGADVIVALCHSGIGSERWSDGMENAVIPLAAIKGLDAIVAGHTHQIFPRASTANEGTDNIQGTPAVMPGAFGHFLGRIQIDVQWENEGWNIVRKRAELKPACETSDDVFLTPAISSAHKRTLLLQDEQVSVSNDVLSTHFSHVAPNAAMDALAQSLVFGVQSEGVPADLAELPVIASVSPSVAGGQGGPDHFVHVTPGRVTRGDIAAIYPYPNQICSLVVSGQGVLDWLETSAACFHVLEPDLTQQPLIRSDRAPYQFETIFGLDYEIDLCAAAPRIRHLSRNGKPVATADRFLMVTNSYRAYGGGGYVDPSKTPVRTTTRMTVRQAITDWLSGHQTKTFHSSWSFTPSAGTKAQFVTAPTANIADLGQNSLHIERGAMNTEGFREFTLCL